ncbi:hypothetical protein ACTVCO_02665 [Sanguibacter sp. A247]|uniref:hypothetical protein n=1 Tax=unclassified Sanguibacter TaxID=2645534 RepID=UPI003FD795F7
MNHRGSQWRRAVLAVVVAFGVSLGGVGVAVAAPDAPSVGAVAGAARAKVRISTQPRSVTAVAGRTATFRVKAKGSRLAYRWQSKAPGARSWKTVKKATRSTLKVKARASADGTRYRVVVTRGRSKATSRTVKLTVVSRPRITAQPGNATAAQGVKATFRVVASGRNLTYSWQRRAVGASAWTVVGQSRVLAVTAATSLHGASYRVVVKNAAGSVVSRTVRLAVPAAPRITTQPRSVQVTAGARVSLTVGATGSDLRFRWQHRADDEQPWADVPGATSATYAFVARTARNGEEFRAVVTNGLGSAVSSAADVFVDSTYADPAAPAAPVFLDEWGVLTVGASRVGTDEVLEENMFNDVPPAGWDYVLVDVFGCFYGSGSSVTWVDLDVEFIGSDGRTYDDGYNLIPNDIDGAGTVYTNGCTTFTAGALVPSNVISGGIWVVTDSVHYPTTTGFIRAF